MTGRIEKSSLISPLVDSQRNHHRVTNTFLQVKNAERCTLIFHNTLHIVQRNILFAETFLHADVAPSQVDL